MSINEALSLNAETKAYLLVGAPKIWRGILTERLSDWLATDQPRQSPDLWWQHHESFGIKDSHELIEKESRRSFGGRGRFFVLEIFSMTPEAQNALLKTFEEPASGSHFFLIAPSDEIFLPTLRSRLMILEASHFVAGGSEPAERPFQALAEPFLKLDVVDRMTLIKEQLLKLKAKDRQKSDLVDFVVGLELSLRQRFDATAISTETAQALLALEQCRRYLADPRSANRLILEHLALALPVLV
ncbi:MAG: hypothetical protein COV08_02085 [Candidatus Vogelbacteria bacterium CG10_big_fil_rev_8_21_14_0_10_49_38]|uniref:DNA polymerase III subunit delta n=1 Tax=Candidatus Vogelbacteria bacterium CG10_big_fil_rev_8_21_14_0_10_49_38 TaxID=1975043 RepID=A0A2H0RHR0_9BACT|nr:MAG: hypothetical protein BK006_02105 [bacterium CG10_49_38]PIR45980.1 MAG: hypothetical protein COV08_02085 [Candidatus Vogelbacteria bacterium CG10_big_fil_rev_8_21_14_0_10_49_38]